MSMGDKTCFFRWSNLPPFEQNVWEVKYSIFIPVRCFSSPPLRVIIELTKIGCESDVVPDIVKMLNIADDSCTNTTVGI